MTPASATNGAQTYGAGRYAEPTLASADATTVTLDFNQAHNPFCAYNPLYACALARGNNLDFKIPAGEQALPNAH